MIFTSLFASVAPRAQTDARFFAKSVLTKSRMYVIINYGADR